MTLSKLACLLLGLVLLSGCATPSIVATVEPVCRAVRHTCVSRADQLTEGTASQIEANNLARLRLCKDERRDPCKAVRTKPSLAAATRVGPVKPAAAPAAPAAAPAAPPARVDPVPDPQPVPAPVAPAPNPAPAAAPAPHPAPATVTPPLVVPPSAAPPRTQSAAGKPG